MKVQAYYELALVSDFSGILTYVSHLTGDFYFGIQLNKGKWEECRFRKDSVSFYNEYKESDLFIVLKENPIPDNLYCWMKKNWSLKSFGGFYEQNYSI